MKLIDAKGRLFGRLNIIDLLVLLVILAAVAVLGGRLMSRGGGDLTGAAKITYTVKVRNVDPAVYEAIQEHIPGQLMASGEMLNAHVVGVTSTPASGGVVISTAGATLSATPQEGLLDLIFTIEGTVSNTTLCEVGTQEVRIGKSHIVKTTRFELEHGVILTCALEAAQ